MSVSFRWCGTYVLRPPFALLSVSVLSVSVCVCVLCGSVCATAFRRVFKRVRVSSSSAPKTRIVKQESRTIGCALFPVFCEVHAPYLELLLSFRVSVAVPFLLFYFVCCVRSWFGVVFFVVGLSGGAGICEISSQRSTHRVLCRLRVVRFAPPELKIPCPDEATHKHTEAHIYTHKSTQPRDRLGVRLFAHAVFVVFPLCVCVTPPQIRF